MKILKKQKTHGFFNYYNNLMEARVPEPEISEMPPLIIAPIELAFTCTRACALTYAFVCATTY